MTALHYSAGKPPLSLVPRAAIVAVADVMQFGLKKYARHNWRGGMLWSELANSTLRHVTSWIDGEDNDSESGLSHLAHALCDLAFLVTYQAERLGTDDRYRRAPEPLSVAPLQWVRESAPNPVAPTEFEIPVTLDPAFAAAEDERRGACPQCDHDFCMCPAPYSDHASDDGGDLAEAEDGGKPTSDPYGDLESFFAADVDKIRRAKRRTAAKLSRGGAC